ncbi:WecB/TagA/CpsF family glycosyltransferase [Rheinheimera marina]|uniref:WecB/TagA/CpsF family glycosyltransferase n=1 Tax=Rheinheimera marina TaxID=1774958 RepID=A0ABV9JR98_9GAMM
MANNNDRVDVLKMSVSTGSRIKLMEQLKLLLSADSGSYVCLSNVHMCMETFDNDHFKNIVNGADLVLPDGLPISMAQRMLGRTDAQQTRGEYVMKLLCQEAATKGLHVGLYGGSSDEVLERVKDSLKQMYPDIVISYAYSPPFRALTNDEESAVFKEINSSRVDILFVGIGCPKQEIWMSNAKPHVGCVMLGVGAAYDFISGSKMHAPIWMQKIGLEWLFRLLSEPKRLWKRYLKQNPRFIFYFLQQLLFKKRFH